MHIKVIAIICVLASVGRGAAVSPLADAGYSVLPVPRQVKLGGATIHGGMEWEIQIDAAVAADDVAVETLKEELLERHHLKLAESAAKGALKVRLTITPGAVPVGPAHDRDHAALAEQAYRIDIADGEIHITANARAGLFYGGETLVQLAKDSAGGVSLPAGEIVDWPDLQLREIYWDDAHHLERPEAMKHAIRQAAFFKINGFVLKLEGHFQYPSAPAIVEPYAMSPGELQRMTDYAAHYHVQLIPYLDCPAHIAFILKHPEYKSLRAFPDSNYELCTENPDSIKLLAGMIDDLVSASKGVKYFYLSTDEPYYLGKSDEPPFSEVSRMKALGSPGKLLSEFLKKTAGPLHDRGRDVVFWGEYPMKPADVASLPPYLINGETDNADFDLACRARGIRQTIYTSIEGEEKLFPDYVIAQNDRLLHKREDGKARVAEGISTINAAVAADRADLTGVLVAGWADMGLHPETFWLGYATVGAAGWNPPATDPARAADDFYHLFYGPSAKDMDRIYALMSTQAQFWADSWESGPTQARKGIWGSSNSIFKPRHPAHDQLISLPPVRIGDDLAVKGTWTTDNTRRLELTRQYLAENDELRKLLQQNIEHIEFNQYNLQVFMSIAQLCRQNLEMLQTLSRVEQAFNTAHQSAVANKPADALAAIDGAVELVKEIRQQRNQALARATKVWYESWYPRVAEANGRTFLHELDDVKDHLPDRTIGMEYLVYRELLLPMDAWMDTLASARNAFAKAHQLPEKKEALGWEKTE